MKNESRGLLDKIVTALTSMARAKTLAIKSKTRALRTRLIIFSLLSNKKFLMSSLTQKLHNVLDHHHHHRDRKLKSQLDGDERDDNDVAEEDRAALVLYQDSMARHAFLNPTRTAEAPVEEKVVDGDRYGYECDDGGDDDGDKYPDLTHSMFDSEDLEFEDPGGSVIDLVKNSKEEAGESFRLEEEIDHVADLFIKRFHRQMRMQKQQSFKEFQEMLQRGA